MEIVGRAKGKGKGKKANGGREVNGVASLNGEERVANLKANGEGLNGEVSLMVSGVANPMANGEENHNGESNQLLSPLQPNQQPLLPRHLLHQLPQPQLLLLPHPPNDSDYQ